jgi:hypothetical protein
MDGNESKGRAIQVIRQPAEEIDYSRALFGGGAHYHIEAHGNG